MVRADQSYLYLIPVRPRYGGTFLLKIDDLDYAFILWCFRTTFLFALDYQLRNVELGLPCQYCPRNFTDPIETDDGIIGLS